MLVVSVACSGGQGAVPTAPTASSTPLTPGRHDVTLTGAGVSLGGALFRPETSESRPAIIVLHGWQPAGTNGVATVEARARRLADEGYVALALALRGWPPSGGADDCALRQPDDVVSAASWLRAQPGVLADRIGLLGFSQGGQVALLAAARDARVRAVVAYYPVTDPARWKTTTTNPDIPGYVTAVCEPGGVSARAPLQRAADIAAPVLLVHGDQDTRVPTEQSLLLQAARVAADLPTELFLVPGAQHGFVAAEEALARPVVDQFLAARLR
jgi:dienelactone hydrolase